MKTKWFLICAFALLTGISFASCSNDDDSPQVPEFPENEGISVNVNETKVLTFDANMEWKLTANKSWITFMDGDAEIGLSDQGAAGKNISRTIKIKDSNWGFNDETDEIKLTMGGETEVIYTITRPGKAREVKMFEEKTFGAAPEETSQINLVFQSERSSLTKIGFIANYDWMIEVPEEINLERQLTGSATELDGTPENANMAYISLKDEYITRAYSGTIKIKDQNGDFVKEFPIKYAGMGNEDLFFDTNRFNQYAGIEFTEDGFFIEQKGPSQNVTTEKTASFAVKVKDDDFSYYLIQIDDQKKPEITTNAWAEVKEGKAKGEFEISVKGNSVNTSSPRLLYFLALPKALATGTPNLSEYFADGTLIPEKGDFVIKISQKGTIVAGGFTMKWGMETTPVADADVIKLDAGMISMIGFGAPADNTYMYSFTDARMNGGLGVFPTGWQGDMTDGYIYKIESILEGDWNAVSHELSYNESQGTFGLLLNNLDKVSGLAVVLFYNSPADQSANKPMGAIVLSKD